MKKLFYFVFLVFFLSSAVHAAEIFEQYHYMENEGDLATEALNIKAADKTTPDLIGTSDSVTFRDAAGKEDLPDQQTVAIGAEASVTKNVKTYNIPLSYGMPLNLSGAVKEYVNFTLKIPYTKREIGNVDDSGLGDIRLSADYLAKFDNLLVNSVFLVKFASGDYDDADVPLGTGSTDFGLSFNAKMYFEKFSVRGGIGYVLTGDYSDSGSEVKYGDEYVLSAGGEYNVTDSMFAGGEFIYNAHMEDDLSGTKYAGLNTFDFVPSFTYLLRKYNFEVTAKLVIPVADSWNGGDGPDPEDPDRDVEFKFQLSRPF